MALLGFAAGFFIARHYFNAKADSGMQYIFMIVKEYVSKDKLIEIINRVQSDANKK